MIIIHTKNDVELHLRLDMLSHKEGPIVEITPTKNSFSVCRTLELDLEQAQALTNALLRLLSNHNFLEDIAVDSIHPRAAQLIRDANQASYIERTTTQDASDSIDEQDEANDTQPEEVPPTSKS